MFSFEVMARDGDTRARLGRLITPHGVVDTPAFMPVGTAGEVKGVPPEQLRQVGVQMVLANTYHLQLRPGADVVERLGGLGRFMGWNGPVLTDSGGYQVFSLAELVEVDDDGVSFRSHIDGARVRLDAAQAVRIQNRLGADIIMVLDECVPSGSDKSTVTRAVERTVRWAGQSLTAHEQADRQWLFAINQGGLYHDLRASCMERLTAMGFPGYAVGGLSVGEPRGQMLEVLGRLEPLMPVDRPRYLMGVGKPHDIVEAVAAGIDLFDCVIPTRNGRNGYAFTWQGPIRLKNERHRLSDKPLDLRCDCPVCRRFSRGYLRHLILAGQMLGPMLVSLHNIAYYQGLVSRLRQAIGQGSLRLWRDDFFRNVAESVNLDEET
ncbi:MAG TPA: tRNA guanosine(34) transglycosylase Tgt [Phycisphaerae bacterium]|nr:tRNA guanosine(34) transglycosylase Tgt [Phycisphaerae bacterium]